MPDSHYNDWANDASVAQSVVHFTRNEKVACSSQVTSSTKTAVFLVKAAVFRTFRACLKEPHFCLASIWRLLRVFSIFFCNNSGYYPFTE